MISCTLLYKCKVEVLESIIMKKSAASRKKRKKKNIKVIIQINVIVNYFKKQFLHFPLLLEISEGSADVFIPEEYSNELSRIFAITKYVVVKEVKNSIAFNINFCVIFVLHSNSSAINFNQISIKIRTGLS